MLIKKKVFLCCTARHESQHIFFNFYKKFSCPCCLSVRLIMKEPLFNYLMFAHRRFPDQNHVESQSLPCNFPSILPSNETYSCMNEGPVSRVCTASLPLLFLSLFFCIYLSLSLTLYYCYPLYLPFSLLLLTA